jgi:type II secretory pathway component GspD/PulD (secretin)
MAGTLEEFFDIDTGSSFFWSPPKKDNATLGKKKEMRFVTDSYTKTLVVLNATPEQHVTIQELIERMDQPEQDEERLVRVTKIFTIKHSQALAIQNVIKEVYRDLLSGNDKDLQQKGNEGGRGKGGSGGGTPSQFFGSSSATYLTEDEDEKVKFKGQLSVSADPISNTLTVSGTASLVKDIGEKIEILDLAARPASNMRVVPVSKNINVLELQKRLEKLIGPKQAPQQQKGKKQGQNQQAPNQGQPN